MTKKVLIVSEYFYPEEFKINELVTEWQKNGFEVDVLTQIPTYPTGKVIQNFKNKWFSKERWNNITIYRVKAITGYKESLFKKLLKYFVFMFNASIVALFIGKKYDYVFGYDVGPLTAMFPGVLISKIYKKPFTIWVHDIWPDSVYAYGFKQRWPLKSALDLYVRFVYKNCSAIAISGPGFLEKVRAYTDNQKIIKFLPSWPDDMTLTDKKFQFSQEIKTHFTFAGNIGKVQNLENVLAGFATLRPDLLDKAQLNIIGDGSHLEFLTKYVKDNHYKNIVFWGKKPRHEMSMYFNGSDFLIVSLIDEPIFSLTIPGKVQTYIAAKKPIFAIISGDTVNIINDNNLGISVHPSNIEVITKGFEYLIQTSQIERDTFTLNCNNLINNTFNKSKIIKEMGILLRNE